jgi:hypothetical protein
MIAVAARFSPLTLLIATGCATITTGTTHTVSIVTDPPGARCEVRRNAIVVGVVDATPGSVSVSKESNALAVTCAKEGYEDVRRFVLASRQGMVDGNFILGGAIGTLIDQNSGAANKYGGLPVITLMPTRFVDAQARDEFFSAQAASTRARADADLVAVKHSAVCHGGSSEPCEAAQKARTEQRDAELDQLEQRRRRAQLGAN